MLDRKEIKATGKINFKGNYWRSVLCAFLIALTAGMFASSQSQTQGEGVSPPIDSQTAGVLLAIAIISLIIKILIANPIQVGCYGFFKDNTQESASLAAIKDGFKDYGHVIATILLRDIYLTLWTMLFIIPGIVKAYSYRMVPFITRDNPQLSAAEVIKESRRMMDGHKWEVFIFDLSYIGWYLFGAITCGLGLIFWTEPYRQNANALIYRKLSEGKRF